MGGKQKVSEPTHLSLLYPLICMCVYMYAYKMVGAACWSLLYSSNISLCLLPMCEIVGSCLALFTQCVSVYVCAWLPPPFVFSFSPVPKGFKDRRTSPSKSSCITSEKNQLSDSSYWLPSSGVPVPPNSPVCCCLNQPSISSTSSGLHWLLLAPTPITKSTLGSPQLTNPVVSKMANIY